MLDMESKIIHLSISRSMKGRWVALSRSAQQKLGSWIVVQVERTLNNDKDNYRSTQSFGVDKDRAVIQVEVDPDLKERWVALSQSDGVRLTDWVVNRVEWACAL